MNARRCWPLVVFSLAALAAGPGGQVARADPGFLRGDATGDGVLNITDAVVVLRYLFQGRALGCLDAADHDASGDLDLGDPVGLLTYLFRRGERPRPPFPDCGVPPQGFLLGCAEPHCVVGPQSGTVWMARADGCFQCQPCRSLEEVVEDLRARGIEVLGAQNVHPFMVCQACDVCPTGRFYAVLVPAEDGERLLAKGWGPLEELPR